MEETKENLNLETFQTTLTQKTNEYAEAAYITYQTPYTEARKAENEAKEKREKELYAELLKICTDTFISANKDKDVIQEIENIIYKTLLWYQYPNGQVLFNNSSRGEFYRRLVMSIATA